MTRHRLVRRVLAGTAVLAVLVMATPVLSQQPPSQEQLARDILALAWQRGPTEGRVGGLATIKVKVVSTVEQIPGGNIIIAQLEVILGKPVKTMEWGRKVAGKSTELHACTSAHV